jgi:DNA-directed RNA polymerase specialized sigma24 family protein
MSKNHLSSSLTQNYVDPVIVGPDDNDRPSIPTLLTEPELPAVPALLADSEPYIRALVCKQIPRDIVPPDTLDLEIDEIVQNVWIKLWKVALQKQTITNVRAYIRVMVHSEIVDMVRKTRRHYPLPVDEDGEIVEGNVLLSAGEGARDPAYEVEQTEIVQQSLAKAVETILALPPLQQTAMICSLEERVDDLLSLVEAFANRSVDIETISRPKEQRGSPRFRASLSIARKKLSKLKTECLPSAISRKMIGNVVY